MTTTTNTNTCRTAAPSGPTCQWEACRVCGQPTCVCNRD